jgi:hypothetical protein
MRTSKSFLFAFVLAVLLVAAAIAQDSEPAQPGVYYKSPSGWVTLEEIRMSGAGATHMAKVLVPGLTPQIVWTYRGAHAPVAVTGETVFCIRDVPAYGDRDALIVRFDAKKDHRELQTTSGGNAATFKSGFSAERTPDFVMQRFRRGIRPQYAGCDSLPRHHSFPCVSCDLRLTDFPCTPVVICLRHIAVIQKIVH